MSLLVKETPANLRVITDAVDYMERNKLTRSELSRKLKRRIRTTLRGRKNKSSVKIIFRLGSDKFPDDHKLLRLYILAIEKTIFDLNQRKRQIAKIFADCNDETQKDGKFLKRFRRSRINPRV